MLQIKNIHKEYRTGSLVQKALDDVSLNLRDNEFVAILGPSGSGKTTLLNIIGGLDRYDDGDLSINGISTKRYKDRDWDSYRNHTIGFVFQSYNLIPHQTVLANVELALTISGIGKAERTERAKEALKQVGLEEQIHKKPNQMSGGQMQRVAIARALVNNPDILLADEPTGALDSETSVQVMELLKAVAKDRLVVMVTHNPELAEAYATRIVNLRDGKILSDSDAFYVDEAELEAPEHRNMGKASMSFLTALALSFNNLRTKKARTLLTSFAGSIGIIGIALILSLSTGVNDYIKNVEEDTLSEYPLQIQSTGFDMTSMMVSDQGTETPGETPEGDIHVVQMVTNMFSTMDSNDLKSLKAYLDGADSGIKDYTNAVEYTYGVEPQIFRQEKDGVRQVHPDKSFDAMGLGASAGSNSMMSMMMSTNVFYEMPENSVLYEKQYDVKAGRWPETYNECVLVLTSGGGISDFLLYTLGLRDPLELDEMIRQFMNEETIHIPPAEGTWNYEDILGTAFKFISRSEAYAYDDAYKVWKNKSEDKEYMKKLMAEAEDLEIVGIVQPKEGANASALSPGIGYPKSLTRHVADIAEKSEIVKVQLGNSSVNVFTNEPFGTQDSEMKSDALFTIDESKLQNAFAFDESALSSGMGGSLAGAFTQAGEGLNLSGMIDLSNISVTLPELPEINMADLVQNIHLSVSADKLAAFTAGIMEGYQAYAKAHPEADYSNLQNDFAAYLETEAAQQILKNHIQSIIQGSGEITVPVETLQGLVRDVMAGYQQFVTENGYTDAGQFDVYFAEYIQTAQAQGILQQYAETLFGNIGDITLTWDQINGLASELASGYQQYAAANRLPDPGKMGDHFLTYLGTEDGQQRITAGLETMVDMAGLQEQIAAPIRTYMQTAMASYGEALGRELENQITAAMQQVTGQLASGMEAAMGQAMQQIGASLQNAMHIDTQAFEEAFQMNMDGEELMELMMSMNSSKTATYESNLKNLGYVDFEVPSGINIYPKDFVSKEGVVKILDDYNSRMEAEGKDEQVITYTDVVGTLMSSVTDIIDVISYVLIAFVAISLVVSSIMIGVITYISVLERKKEIGILRAIGASKGNISQVFNAETFIIGLCAGLIGIGITALLLIPGNALIHHLAGTAEVSAVLPVVPAVILIGLSVLLTLLGGLIPSKKAAKSDPVTALRTE